MEIQETLRKLGKVDEVDGINPKWQKSKKPHAQGHAETLIKPCPFCDSVETWENTRKSKKSFGIYRKSMNSTEGGEKSPEQVKLTQNHPKVWKSWKSIPRNMQNGL